ncbi:uncharacterized protein LOC119120686 isoform X2 [Syngnathus acus]|uniref:uncharacterized protein LOC119120686 isoform X2 n=1 Tax=Syngnathus acus TaxID=161584 RepID=UPI001885F264|nr:uncharacterized protein LOC119120686 isoform X2 [Syngnathus acus]
MFVVLLVIVGNIATSAALSGLNLDCINDYVDLMSCHFEAPNCTDYNVTLRSLDGEHYCLRVGCASGKCCCSIHMILVLDENHVAFVHKDGKYVESKNISVKYSFKPQTPTIIAVNETNGNFQVIWTTNISKRHIREILRTRLYYRKKGETQEIPKVFQAPQVEKPECALCFTTDILGAHLEPSTTYVVTVQNLLPWESKPSDRSEEYEFTTPVSRKSLRLILIISLSLLAVTITSAAYLCYVKCKAKYWDSVSDQNSKLLKIHPTKEEILKPMPPIISSISVETLTPGDLKPWSKGSLMDSSTESLLQSSGFSSGQPSLTYALTEAADIIAGVQGALSKALMNIVPVAASTDHLLKESSKAALPSPSGQLSGLENTITYSFIRPSCPVQVTPDPLKSHAQSEMPCDCGYQGSGAGTTCDDKQGSACEENMFPATVSSYTLTATSHQANRDSGRFSIGENSDPSLSSSNTSLSGDVESRMVAGHEHCQVMFSQACNKGADVPKDLRCLPASLQSTFPVDGNYQAFQGLSKLSDSHLEDQKSVKKQDLNKAWENFSEDSIQGDTCFPAQSNHSFLVDDNYQAFQSLRELSDSRFEGQNNDKNQDLDQVLENCLEDTNKDGTPLSSKLCLTDRDEAFQGLPFLSDGQFGALKTIGKQHESLENVTNIDTCTPNSFPCLVDDNHLMFQDLRALPQSQFEEKKSGKQNQDKVLEKSVEDDNQGHTCVPPSSNHNFPVDDNYQVFRGVRELADSQFGQPSSGSKEDLKKTSENSFEGVCLSKTYTPTKSTPSFPVDDNYKDFRGFRDDQVGERKSVDKENLVKDVENTFKDSTVNLQGILPVDDNYQVCRRLSQLPDSHVGEQDNENKDSEKSSQDSLEEVTKSITCIPVVANLNVPIDDNYQAFYGLRQNFDNKVGEPKGGEKEDVLETPLKGVQCCSHIPANLRDNLPVEDNYQVIRSLTKQADVTPAGQRSSIKDDRAIKDVSKGDDCTPESLQDRLLVDDHYKVIQSSPKLCDKFSEHKGIKRNDLETAFEMSLPVMPGGPSSPEPAASTEHVHGHRHLPEPQMPFLPIISTDLRNDIITESGYKII